MTKAVAKRVETEVQVESSAPPPALRSESATILSMLQTIMTDPTVSIERVNQAFDFYQRVEAAQAKKAFDAAMADAKAEFEPIVKRHEVAFGEGKNRTSYKHEDLADISAAVDPSLAKYGLNVRHRATSNPNEPIRVTCIVTHRMGYSEETTLSAGADGSGGKNSIQSIGSTLTYLQRYTKRLALGLAVGRDNDGKDADIKPSDTITDEQEAQIREAIEATGTELSSFASYFKIEKLSDLKAVDFTRAITALNKKASR